MLAPPRPRPPATVSATPCANPSRASSSRPWPARSPRGTRSRRRCRFWRNRRGSRRGVLRRDELVSHISVGLRRVGRRRLDGVLVDLGLRLLVGGEDVVLAVGVLGLVARARVATCRAHSVVRQAGARRLSFARACAGCRRLVRAASCLARRRRGYRQILFPAKTSAGTTRKGVCIMIRRSRRAAVVLGAAGACAPAFAGRAHAPPRAQTKAASLVFDKLDLRRCVIVRTSRFA